MNRKPGSTLSDKIVISILRFLSTELDSQLLDDDAAESLEVALQCLESAYGMDRNLQAPDIPDMVQVFMRLLGMCSENFGNTAVVPPEKKAEAEKLKTIGNNLMKLEKYAEAAESYTAAICWDHTNAVYYCNRAAAQSKLDNQTAAIEDCKIAIRLDPSYSKAYGRLGIAYSSLNQHQDARNSYLKALALEPDNESYKNNLHLTDEEIAKTMPPSTSDPGFDLNMLINNPALMSMASQMLTNPNMQNLMAGLISVGQGEANVDALVQAGQQLAQQMQSTNPEFVENLRRQMGTAGVNSRQQGDGDMDTEASKPDNVE